MYASKTAAMTQASRLAQVMAAQYASFMRKPWPNLFAYMDEADVRVWYFMVVGLDAPYLGGEYIFRLTAEDTFPDKPPKFEFITPNGLFEPGGPICISIGEYHADDNRKGAHGGYGWRRALGMTGFAEQVVNALICHADLGSGIRIVETTDAVKTGLAAASAAWNIRGAPTQQLVFEETYVMSPHTEAALNLRDGRLRLEGKPVPSRVATVQPAAAVPPLAVQLPLPAVQLTVQLDAVADEVDLLSELLDGLTP